MERRGWRVGLGAFVLVCGGVVGARDAGGQQTAAPPDVATRQLWDDAFVRNRPPAAKRPARPPRTAQAAAPSAQEAFVGVTIWRLQPAGADATRSAPIQSTSGEGWLAHRVELGSSFSEGHRVRLSLEASRSGYLYVIDREQYADGSFGEPYLIFPTLRLRQGNNEVRAGRVVEVPDLSDHPPFFTIKRGRPEQVAEVLTVLVTSTPLEGLTIGRSPVPLSNAQLQEWERNWSAPTRALELPGGAGRPYTVAEKDAAGNAERLLTQEDPLPQTLYRIASKPGQPVLVAVPLSFKRTD